MIADRPYAGIIEPSRPTPGYDLFRGRRRLGMSLAAKNHVIMSPIYDKSLSPLAIGASDMNADVVAVTCAELSPGYEYSAEAGMAIGQEGWPEWHRAKSDKMVRMMHTGTIEQRSRLFWDKCDYFFVFLDKKGPQHQFFYLFDKNKMSEEGHKPLIVINDDNGSRYKNGYKERYEALKAFIISLHGNNGFVHFTEKLSDVPSKIASFADGFSIDKVVEPERGSPAVDEEARRAI